MAHQVTLLPQCPAPLGPPLREAAEEPATLGLALGPGARGQQPLHLDLQVAALGLSRLSAVSHTA